MNAKEAQALKKGETVWVDDRPFIVVETGKNQTALTTKDRYTKAERVKKTKGPNDPAAAALVIRYPHSDIDATRPFEEKPAVDIARLVSGSPLDVGKEIGGEEGIAGDKPDQVEEAPTTEPTTPTTPPTMEQAAATTEPEPESNEGGGEESSEGGGLPSS